MKRKLVSELGFLFLMFTLIFGCVSSPKISEEMEMIQPILNLEYENIIKSIPENSPVAVWWSFDRRFDNNNLSAYDEEPTGGTVTVISDWVQSSFEKMLVDSKKISSCNKNPFTKNIQGAKIPTNWSCR